ncbi:hypothetical protein H6G89_18375 [Oscillatoria sp. FACHB-1407]|uniref:hypothetical protein n=1 Tax=Oscillatoria sp. FACHB-1407 TaxID=2692847 RepID=UPI001684CBD7|nr:hypothetical protein [Oscillatoria sp. FACHB-1407]MBD2463010.1 hypothetical protein [Oscillatoria sp. FACHB-1407]
MVSKVSKSVAHVYSEILYRANLARYSRRLPALNSDDRQIVDTLKQEGVFITTLEQLALPSTAQLLRSVEKVLPTMATNLPSENSGKKKTSNHAVLVPTKQLITNYPEICLWGLEERLLNIVESYIGLPVAYLGASVRKDIDTQRQIGTRFWHRDAEDRRTIKVIVYLNDVDEQGGPFEYIPRSLTMSYRPFKKVNGIIRDADMQEVVPRTHWKMCCGSTGTVVITDTTSVFHHGKVPRYQRTALFFTYTSRQPKRADISKSRFSTLELLDLASRNLSPRQRECLLWESGMLDQYYQAVAQRRVTGLYDYAL